MNEKLEAKLNAFFERYKYRSYKKGEFLIWPDDDNEIFYLKSGTVIEYIISKKGNEGILAFYLPKDVFPLNFVNGTNNDHYFEALFRCEAYRAPSAHFIKFVKDNADVAFALLSQTNAENGDLKMRMTYNLAGDAYSKLIQEILIIAKYAGVKDEKSGSILLVNFVERYASARTGLTTETVSREMKKLKKKGLLDFRRNILIIKDVGLLQQELESY